MFKKNIFSYHNLYKNNFVCILPSKALVEVRHRLKTENGEDYDTGIDSSKGITYAYKDDIANTIIIRSVIASEGYE